LVTGVLLAVSSLALSVDLPAEMQTAHPSFEAASVKANKSGASATSLGFQQSGRFRAVNEPLWRLIAEAYRSSYQLRRFEIVDIPDWIDGERFDVEAVPEGNPTPGDQHLMLQSLLVERFKLAVHQE